MTAVLDDREIVTISPHYDDAVLSCGHLLAQKAGSTVLTVFTGVPPDALHVCTDWDRHCGFQNAKQAMLAREAENKNALRLLHQKTASLDLLDGQYVAQGQDSGLTSTLAAALSRLNPGAVLMPMGLFHGDHVRVSEAALRIRGLFRQCLWLVYEDIPYRDKPGLLQARLAELLARHIHVTPAAIAPAPSLLKMQAVQAYRSQLQELGLLAASFANIDGAQERYWSLTWP